MRHINETNNKLWDKLGNKNEAASTARPDSGSRIRHMANLAGNDVNDMTGQAQKEKEPRFQKLIENSLDGIAILNSDHTIRYLSPSVERIVGYRPEEMLGKDALEFLHPDDADRIASRSNVAVDNTAKLVPVEVRVRHKDGSWCILEGIANDLMHDPMINGVVLNYRDITDRVQAVNKVKEREEQFRLLIEYSLDGIAILNSNLTIRYLSPSVERIVGYKPEELIGKNPLKFIHPDDASHFVGNSNAFDSSAENPRPVEFRFLHKDGSWRVMEGFTNNLLDDSRINGIIVNYHDITERKRAEEIRAQILALQAVALQAQGELDQALSALESTVSVSESDGYTQTIFNENKPVLDLLHHAALRGIAPNYARKLLENLRASTSRAEDQVKGTETQDSPVSSIDARKPQSLKPLTDRELEVLQLIAAGSSNYEIAQALIIAIGTVRKHINNIHAKLGVCKRTLAVTRAQELGLLR